MLRPTPTIIAIATMIFMIALIPIVQNDYFLTAIYILFAAALIYVGHGKGDILLFFLGLGLMTVFEYIFVRTGVETFIRNTLLGVMPLWLPVLWGTGFVGIKRTILDLIA